MNALRMDEVRNYLEANIGDFHQKRIENLSTLSLIKVLQKKNPYLFKAKYFITSEQFVKAISDAFLSSKEETIFGNWMEGLVIFINKMVFSGWKSGIPGIDLEFDKDGIRYIVTIKSGPNWGNANQIKRMISDFNAARKTLRTGNSTLNVIAVNGCCYGRDSQPDKKGIYFKYCGQEFWDFISGSPTLFKEIVEPLGIKAKERNEDFKLEYSKMINRFTLEFSLNFCKPSGEINWEKIVVMNSAKDGKEYLSVKNNN